MQDAFSKGSLLFHLFHMDTEELFPAQGSPTYRFAIYWLARMAPTCPAFSALPPGRYMPWEPFTSPTVRCLILLSTTGFLQFPRCYAGRTQLSPDTLPTNQCDGCRKLQWPTDSYVSAVYRAYPKVPWNFQDIPWPHLSDTGMRYFLLPSSGTGCA